MKLNLLIDNPGRVRSGYLNIDPFSPEGDISRIRNEITKLDAIVDDGEVEEIVVDGVLEYFPANITPQIISHWAKKLSIRGGKLYLTFTELRMVCKAIANMQIDADVAAEMLFGKQEKQWQFKKAGFTLDEIESLVSSLGLRITSKTIANFNVTVVIERK